MLWEFGVIETRYANCHIVVVGEMAIDFSANRVQPASYPIPNAHRSRDEFGLRAIRYVNYRVAVGPLEGQGWE